MNTEEQAIRQFISEEILFSGGRYPYGDDASFLTEGIVDSMNVLQLVMYVEKHFGIKIKDEEITPENFDSVLSLANYVRGKLAVKV